MLRTWKRIAALHAVSPGQPRRPLRTGALFYRTLQQSKFPKQSLQALTNLETASIQELIIYLVNNEEANEYMNIVHRITPLPFDPGMVPYYLSDLINKKISQELVDDVDSFYTEMNAKDRRNRHDLISIIGAEHFDDIEDED